MKRTKILFLFIIISVLPSFCINHSNVKDSITATHESAFFHADMGDYAQAIKIEQEIVNSFQGKPICPDYIYSLNNLAAFYSDFGEYEKAMQLGYRIIEIMDSVEIGINGKYEIFQHIAIYYERVGNHEKSQEYGHLALNIAKEMHWDTWAYPRSLVFLAYSYSELGDFDNAIKLCLAAKNIYDSHEYKHDDYGYVFNDLGAYYCGNGELDKAIDYGWAYVNFLKEKKISDKQKHIIALNNLARYYAINKDNRRALELSLQAWKMIEKDQMSSNYLKGRTAGHIATFYANFDEYNTALKYSEKSISYFREIWSIERPGMINQLRKHFAYSLFTDNILICEKDILDVDENISNVVLSAFSFLPNSGRSLYWERNYASWYEKELPIYIHTLQTDSLISHGYNSLLLSKGILLNTEVEIKQFIESTNDPVLINKFYDLQNLYLALLNSNEVKKDSIVNYLKEQEAYLVSSCKKYGDYTQQLKVRWQDIQKNLSDDEIAIEFSKVEVNGENRYVAYTLNNKNPIPQYFNLCSENDLRVDKNLYDLIWKPLEDELTGKEYIYFSPIGELYTIPIEYVFCSEKQIIAEKYKMYRLSSTRELVKKGLSNTEKKIVLYGGLNYDADISDFNIDTIALDYKNVSFAIDSIGLRGGYNYLKGTLDEVRAIDSLYNTVNIHSTLYTGCAGNELSFKLLSGCNITGMHIATHGFYWTETELNNNIDYKKRMLFWNDEKPRYIEDRSMTRSGLLLSGVNSVLKNDTIWGSIEDGILTAEEISKLNFRNLDLLVLSACQTGLGEIKGDGVFGLQRGFKKAGVQTIVMSLWKVDDTATQMLMTELYRNLLNGMSKRESLLEAQNAVRNFKGYINGEKRNFSNPKYWAGFILLDGIESKK